MATDNAWRVSHLDPIREDLGDENLWYYSPYLPEQCSQVEFTKANSRLTELMARTLQRVAAQIVDDRHENPGLTIDDVVDRLRQTGTWLCSESERDYYPWSEHPEDDDGEDDLIPQPRDTPLAELLARWAGSDPARIQRVEDSFADFKRLAALLTQAATEMDAHDVDVAEAVELLENPDASSPSDRPEDLASWVAAEFRRLVREAQQP